MARKKKTESTAIVPAAVPAAVPEGAIVREDLLEYLALISAVEMTDQVAMGEQVISGAECIGRIHDLAYRAKKAWNDARLEKVRGFRAQEEASNEGYRPVIETCDAILEACTARLQAHADAQDASKRAALAAMNEAGPSDVLAAAASAPVELPPQVKIKVETSWRLVNLAEVPPEFLQVNEKAIKEHIRTTQGTVPIPGIEFVREKTVVRS